MEPVNNIETKKNVNKNTKKRNKQILSWSLIAVSIALVVYVIWSTLKDAGGDMKNVTFSQVVATWAKNWIYLVIALGLYVITTLCETMKYFFMIHKKTGTTNFRISLKTTIIGNYYNGITPLGSGGQPFQIFYLNKAGLESGPAGAITIISFFLTRLAFFILCIAALIFDPLAIPNNSVRILAYVGIGISFVVPLIIIMISIFPKFMLKLTNGVVKLITKLKFIKNKEKIEKSVNDTLNNYSSSIREFKDAKLVLVLCLILSTIGYIALASVPYFVILASQTPNMPMPDNFSYFLCVSMGLLAYASVTFIPTPGTSGAAELSFTVIFKFVLLGGYLVYGMLLWRFITFYLVILVGLILVISDHVRKKKVVHIKQKRSLVSDDHGAEEITGSKFSVAIFNDNFYPIIDGVVKVVDNYAIELNKRGVKTFVIAPRTKGFVDEGKDYEVVRSPSIRPFKFEYPIATPGLTSKVKKRLKEGTIAIYHVHSPFGMGHYALKMAKKNKVPIVATFHSKFYDDFHTALHSKFFARVGVRYVVRFLKKCTAVWTVSDSTAITLREYGFKGEIKVMPNGTNFVYPNNATEIINKTKAIYNIDKDERILLFVGHLIWQKNLKLILDVMNILKNDKQKYRLILVGEGGSEKAVKAYAEKLNLTANNVNFLGKIANVEELQGIYGSAGLFFFPSTYDTFGIVVCEAAVMKVPSLLVKGSNAAENIIDNVNGYTAENNCEAMVARIREIFDDEKQKDIVGEKASDTLPTSWANLAKKVQKEYSKIIKEYYEKESI